MKKQRIKKIINIISWVAIAFCLICFLDSLSGKIEVKNECKALYEKEKLTAKDLKINTFAYSTVTESDGEEGEKIAVQYKKLYGVEHVADFELDEDGSIAIEFLHIRGRAKVLILNEDGKEQLYQEITKVSEITFEPGAEDGYDVYLVGNRFTGRVVFSTY